jgi:hypothetical protein|tara:strand:- start:2056 stop:2193 length:138 start_codon:yes stop_codon:yes gene_type:complete
MRSENEKISAVQTLDLWNIRVLKFDYEIKKNTTTKSSAAMIPVVL